MNEENLERMLNLTLHYGSIKAYLNVLYNKTDLVDISEGLFRINVLDVYEDEFKGLDLKSHAVQNLLKNIYETNKLIVKVLDRHLDIL